MERTHDLKIHSRYFDRIQSGQKTFEIRKNDRDYQVGDKLFLREFDKENPESSDVYQANPRYMSVKVIYTSTFQQKDGYIVLGISVAGEHDQNPF